MDDAQSPIERDRRGDYLTVLRRRWWVVAACSVLLAGAIYGLSSIQTPQYQATTQLLVKDPGSSVIFDRTGGVVSDPKRLVETQIQLIRSHPVLELAQTKLAEAGIADDVRELLRVSSVPNTNLVNVTITHPTPTSAQALSAAVADAYLEQFRRQTLNELAAQASELEEKIGSIRTQVRDLDGRIAETQKQVDDSGRAATSSVTERLASLRKERDQALAQQSVYQTKLDQVQVDSTLRSQSVLLAVPAAVPTVPVSPRPVSAGMLGLAAGLVIGVGLAFVFDLLDDSIRTREEATAVLGAEPLGLIPRVADWKRDEDAKVVTISEPDSVTSESFRSLRTGVRFAALSRGANVIMVTSPGASEGKSFVATNLAVVAAEAGQRVVLVDADLRRPRTHRFVRLTNHEGLTTAMLGERAIADLLRRPIWPRVAGRLAVLTSGPVPPNPSELLGMERMAQLIATLRTMADLVIVDSAPAVPVTDAAVLASQCDAVLVVVRARSTSRRASRVAMERLRAVGANVLGFVLNGAAPGSEELPSYYYQAYGSNGSTPHKVRQSAAAVGNGTVRPPAMEPAPTGRP